MADTSSSSSKVGIQVALLAAVIAIMGYAYKLLSGGEEMPDFFDEEETTEEEVIEFDDIESTYQDFLPYYGNDKLIDHHYYTLSYSEKHEQAEWVTYEMDVRRLVKNVERGDNFRQDKDIPTGSASVDDYYGSGYDRGHLVPAADMQFSSDAMYSSFLMSNVCPQERSFNRGIWRELEEQVRDWTRGYKHLYIVTGPVLTKRAKARIGEVNDVTVPAAFYKILLDYEGPEQKAVAFVIPNEKSGKPLDYYAMSVDEAEDITGIDFFADLPDRIEDKLEKTYSVGRWPFDEERFRARVKEWNEF